MQSQGCGYGAAAGLIPDLFCMQEYWHPRATNMAMWYLFLIPVVFLGVYVLQSRQPLFLFLRVVLGTVLLCSGLGLVGLKLKGYMGFIVYVGGLFILFGYMISLISMDLKTSHYAFWGSFIRAIRFLLIWVYDVEDIKSRRKDINVIHEFGEFNPYLVIGLAIILLVIMVAVVKLRNLDKGCLRHELGKKQIIK